MASSQTLQSVRFFTRSTCLFRKPNFQRPNVPGTERRLLNAVTVPIYPSDSKPPMVKCLEQAEARKEQRRSELGEAYKNFRLKQAIKVFNENKMVAICHALPMLPKDLLQIRTKLAALDLKVVFMRNDIAIQATENSKFHHLQPYFTSNNLYIISPQAKVAELVKVMKKIPELVLLGGLVEDRIMSRDSMLEVAKLPPLDTMRGELLTILKASASKTHRLLGNHQQELSRCLGQLANPNPSADNDSDVSSSGDSKEDGVDR